MTQIEQDIQALFDYLLPARQPRRDFRGTEPELGQACGLNKWRIHAVLARVRTAEWVDDHHWTVPYVKRGGETNVWRIIDTSNQRDNMLMRWSQHRRADEVLKTTRRNISQCQLALAACRRGTRAARAWDTALRLQVGTEAALELVLSELR
jgi:hypothetical protein